MSLERKIYEKTRANGQKAEVFVVSDDDGESCEIEVRIDGEEYETGFPRMDGRTLKIGKVGFVAEAAKIFQAFRVVAAEWLALPREDTVIIGGSDGMGGGFRTVPYSRTIAGKLGKPMTHDDEEEVIHGFRED